MHLEVLVEDSSGREFLNIVLPKILGPLNDQHSWRIIAYKGIGRVPAGMNSRADPAKRILLDNLPRLLRGYGRTPGIGHVVIILDTDKRPCRNFLAELHALSDACIPRPATLFRLAIEEMEAWLLGDQNALLTAYPFAKRDVLGRYEQDAICGTWEVLADAIHPGGSAALKKAGFAATGAAKHEWARRIAPHLDIGLNRSPSFSKFRDGLRRVVAQPS